MANPEHLADLEHGVDAWNAARKEASALPDLEGADLSQRDLAGIDLESANLRGANLQGCNLEGADLTDGWLEGADLRAARLVDARLAGARMARCRLEDAVLVLPGQNLGDAEQLATLLRGAQAWASWCRDHPDVPRDLPAQAWRAKLVRTQQGLAAALSCERFEGDPAHRALLHAGVERWNAWREENPDARPDLRGANLCDAELGHANLQQADLSGAVLARARLFGADLSGALLAGAFLCGAELDHATLIGTELFQADLSGASLVRANLSGCHCGEANLTGACLAGTMLEDARQLEEADFFEGSAVQLAMLYEDAMTWGTTWDAWRQRSPGVTPDLRGANLIGLSLRDADLSGACLVRAHLSRARGFRARLAGANLQHAKLIEADLLSADLEGARLDFAALGRSALGLANLNGASLVGADLGQASLHSARLAGARLQHASASWARFDHADLSRADLSHANLSNASLAHAILSDADLSGASLRQAMLVEAKLDGSTLTGANVYGVSAWGLELGQVRDQTNLHITPEGRAGLTVDNLELAQFVYLMVHNEKIRGIIDTIGRKAVLILGRFQAERKLVLDALKARLRDFDLVPIVFDWDKPTRRDLTETVALLASMSRFVVADVTDAKSIPQELSEIVPRLPSVPVQPILLQGDAGYAMFEHWQGYRTMLPVYRYRDQADLIDNTREAIIAPVEAWEAGVTRQASLEDELKAKDAEIERLSAMLQARGAGG